MKFFPIPPPERKKNNFKLRERRKTSFGGPAIFAAISLNVWYFFSFWPGWIHSKHSINGTRHDAINAITFEPPGCGWNRGCTFHVYYLLPTWIIQNLRKNPAIRIDISIKRNCPTKKRSRFIHGLDLIRNIFWSQFERFATSRMYIKRAIN